MTEAVDSSAPTRNFLNPMAIVRAAPRAVRPVKSTLCVLCGWDRYALLSAGGAAPRPPGRALRAGAEEEVQTSVRRSCKPHAEGLVNCRFDSLPAHHVLSQDIGT